MPPFQKIQQLQVYGVSWRALSRFSDRQPKLLRRQRSHVRIVSGAPVFLSICQRLRALAAAPQKLLRPAGHTLVTREEPFAWRACVQTRHESGPDQTPRPRSAGQVVPGQIRRPAPHAEPLTAFFASDGDVDRRVGAAVQGMAIPVALSKRCVRSRSRATSMN